MDVYDPSDLKYSAYAARKREIAAVRAKFERARARGADPSVSRERENKEVGAICRAYLGAARRRYDRQRAWGERGRSTTDPPGIVQQFQYADHKRKLREQRRARTRSRERTP